MAAKKNATRTKSTATATSTKAGAKSAGTKRTTKKPAGTAAAAETATKAGTPKKAAAPKTTAPKAAPKKAPTIKLTDKQKELLQKVHSSGTTGYPPAQKNEERSLESLREKKLLKQGAKDKTTGKKPYMTTKAGEKFLATV